MNSADTQEHPAARRGLLKALSLASLAGLSGWTSAQAREGSANADANACVLPVKNLRPPLRLPASASAPALAWQAAGEFVAIGEHHVFVHRRGKGHRETLLLIHGFPTSCLDWREVVAKLSDRYDCIALDLIGFGLSDKPSAWSYSLFQQADVVEGLLGQFGVSSAHVLSHDMGTSLHGELLARQAEGRLSFKLQSSSFLNGSMLKKLAQLTKFQQILQNPATLDEGKKMVAGMLPSYVSQLKGLMGKPEVVSAEEAVVMTELMAHNEGNLRLPNVYCYVRERYLHTDRWIDAMRSEGKRVQLIWGDADPVAVIAMGREMHRLLPEASYTELPGIGHFVPLEAPDQVAELVGRFIGA